MSWNWVNSHTALLAFGVTGFVAALTLANTVLSRRYRRQDAFLKMHDLLTTPEMQRGRRLLYDAGRGGELPPYGSEEYDMINRVLAAHNNLAMYVRRGVIRKSWALDGWHRTLLDLKPGTAAMVKDRMRNHPWRVWTDLELLIAEAEKYRCTRACCSDLDGAVTGVGDHHDKPNTALAPAPD